MPFIMKSSYVCGIWKKACPVIGGSRGLGVNTGGWGLGVGFNTPPSCEKIAADVPFRGPSPPTFQEFLDPAPANEE